MSDQNEKLSGLMDEYRDTDQDQLVLNELQRDVNQQNSLRRYQLMGDVMRHELPEKIQLDFVAQLSAQIELEPALNVQTRQVKNQVESQPSWFRSMLFKPLAGLAVAATVAVVTVLSLQLGPTDDSRSESVAAVDTSSARVEQLAQIPVISNAVRVSGNAQSSATSGGMNWNIKRNEPDIQVKLNTYLINHNEYSNSMNGIIPQVRVVGFDGQR